VSIAWPALLAVLLFSVGVYGVLARRNAILVLMSVELMLNAVNLNLVTFDVWLRDRVHTGQVLTLFVITIAAAEIGLGLAIVLLVYRNRSSIDVDRLRELGEEVERRADEQADWSTADNEAPARSPAEGARRRARP
jgi:NADH-quinone oxidoreductase subunit K